jgi:hypothetical protein
MAALLPQKLSDSDAAAFKAQMIEYLRSIDEDLGADDLVVSRCASPTPRRKESPLCRPPRPWQRRATSSCY